MDRSELELEDLRGMTADGDSMQNSLRQVMVTGAAVTLPLIVTLIVFGFVLNFISNALDPLVLALNRAGIATGVGELATEAIAVLALVLLVFAVGLIARTREIDRLGNTVEAVIEGIPGVGAVYTSFNRMSEVLLDSDTQSFQEVKLVEFPHDGSYVLAFLTAEAPAAIEEAAGHEDMLTLFVPMAPNPVMGGHLVSLPADRIHDVDLTVEEGVRAIMTSGVAIGSVDRHLDPEQLASLTDDERPNDIPESDPDRVEAYARKVGAGQARTPADVAERRNDGNQGTLNDTSPNGMNGNAEAGVEGPANEGVDSTSGKPSADEPERE